MMAGSELLASGMERLDLRSLISNFESARLENYQPWDPATKKNYSQLSLSIM